jgi:hypothetical protein
MEKVIYQIHFLSLGIGQAEVPGYSSSFNLKRWHNIETSLNENINFIIQQLILLQCLIDIPVTVLQTPRPSASEALPLSFATSSIAVTYWICKN